MSDYDSGPRLDEIRHSQPEAPLHRSRKDRKRWCRGKVGVEHVLQRRMSKWGTYWRNTGRPPCEWRCWWTRDADGHVVRDETTWHYACSHEDGCSVCGKILNPVLDAGCPDYAPRVPS